MQDTAWPGTADPETPERLGRTRARRGSVRYAVPVLQAGPSGRGRAMRPWQLGQLFAHQVPGYPGELHGSGQL